MTYKLEFLEEALDEWHALNHSIKKTIEEKVRENRRKPTHSTE